MPILLVLAAIVTVWRYVVLRRMFPALLIIALSGTFGLASVPVVTPSKANEPASLRQVFITVDATRGVTAFVLPGDRIDIEVTRSVDGDTVSSIVLKDIKVLAIDPVDRHGLLLLATIAVDETQAKKLALAREVGTFSFVLRQLEDEACRDGMILNPNCLAQ